MPFFVISIRDGGSGDRSVSTGEGFETREAADLAAAEVRTRDSDSTFVVVEALSPMAAMARSAPWSSLPPLVVTVVQSPAEMSDALAVRRKVFIEEQGVSEDEEIDEHDGDPAQVTTAVHVLGYLEGSRRRPVATARLLLDHSPGEYPHIGRVAVLWEFRGLGFGRAVMEALHEEARRRGIEAITLAAQLHALPFYERLDYVARGDVFLDARIEHRWMDLRL